MKSKYRCKIFANINLIIILTFFILIWCGSCSSLSDQPAAPITDVILDETSELDIESDIINPSDESEPSSRDISSFTAENPQEAMYKYNADNPVYFDITDTMRYICEDADRKFTKEHILNFDANAYYFGPITTGRNAGNDEYIYIVSEDRNFYGFDGVLVYSGGSNSDNSLGSFNFIIPNITLSQYKKIIGELENFTQQAINIAYYEEEYFQQKVKEIPEVDNHYPYIKLLIEIEEMNEILSIYDVKDEGTVINNSELNIQTDSIKLPTPRQNWQDWQDFYSISVWWAGENIVKDSFTEILPWHKNSEKIYNELYIIVHYPLA